MLDSIKQIGALLRTARLQKGLSQRALSARTRIPQNHISKIENGEVNLQISTLIEMARSLDLELMLAPRTLVPTFQALIKKPQGEMQIPKYQLDEDEGDDERF
jgi:transcriptional regulator with XRE-family HTH domain